MKYIRYGFFGAHNHNFMAAIRLFAWASRFIESTNLLFAHYIFIRWMCACACLLSTTSCVAVHFFFQICRQNTHFKYVKCRQRTSIVVHVMHEAIKYLFAKVMNVNNHTRYDHIQEIERHSKTDFLKITLKSFQTKNLVTVWLNKSCISLNVYCLLTRNVSFLILQSVIKTMIPIRKWS